MLPINDFYSLLFGQWLSLIFVFGLVKNVLSLIWNTKIYNFIVSKFIINFNRELNLLIKDTWNIPDSITVSSNNLRMQLEYQGCCSQWVLFDIYEHYFTFYLCAYSWYEFYLEFVDLFWFYSKLLFAYHFKIFTAFVPHLIKHRFIWWIC